MANTKGLCVGLWYALSALFCSDVVWTHNGVTLPPPRKVADEFAQKYVTTIEEVTARDSGVYECDGTSLDDETRRTISLSIEVFI